MAETKTELKQLIEAANQATVERIFAADPVLVDIAPASEFVAGLQDRMILHSGPPIEWSGMSGAQRGACIGMAIFEGWAATPEEAVRRLQGGAIRLEPNHHHGGVGPMAGTTTRSLPVYVVENATYGNRAYCRPAEGRQQFGDYSPEAIETLVRWRDVWAPTLRSGLRELGGLKLKPILVKSLQMGDDLHNRPVAASSLFANAMAPALVQAGVARPELLATLGYITNHELLFLSLSMAAAKCSLDPAAGIEHSSVVTTMCRNGTEFGIRVSGLGDEWFTAPAPGVGGLFLPGFGEQDAGRDMGDSAITETAGWGGFVLAGATGILALVGGTPEQAIRWSRDMYRITTGSSPTYRIPALGFEGTPVGIDIRKVVQTGIEPVIDTAMAHREPGHPVIGAGIVRAPLECFKRALVAFGQRYAA